MGKQWCQRMVTDVLISFGYIVVSASDIDEYSLSVIDYATLAGFLGRTCKPFRGYHPETVGRRHCLDILT